jgi:membrane protease YdiL (CAAX protease family)
VLLGLVLAWPVLWYLLGAALAHRRPRTRLARLARVLAYDLLTVVLAVAVVVEGAAPVPAEVALGAAPAALLGLALGGLGFLALAGTEAPVALRGLAAGRRLGVQGATFSITSVAEELIWRWFLLGQLWVVAGWPAWAAVGVSAVLFGALHLGLSGLPGVVTHTVAGGVLAVAFALTGSLVLVCAAHVAYNLAVVSLELGRRAPSVGRPATG